ncbi:MAG: hypothetical protein A4E66_01713 [Syntrophus sp. PtaB.Bin001]|nr:MAG: hypothetical protein A4E66_01713 [Syntrophus sp. PtaB.Bin001]
MNLPGLVSIKTDWVNRLSNLFFATLQQTFRRGSQFEQPLRSRSRNLVFRPQAEHGRNQNQKRIALRFSQLSDNGNFGVPGTAFKFMDQENNPFFCP